MSKRLPLYQCHKQVRAAQIVGVNYGGVDRAPSLDLIVDTTIISVDVTDAWIRKFQPEIGGYYVVYADGYASYSPAKAFEDGYTLLDDRRSWKERVVSEKKELDEKRARLSVFMATPMFDELTAEVRKAMRRQASMMYGYSEALQERIDAFER